MGSRTGRGKGEGITNESNVVRGLPITYVPEKMEAMGVRAQNNEGKFQHAKTKRLSTTVGGGAELLQKKKEGIKV